MVSFGRRSAPVVAVQGSRYGYNIYNAQNQLIYESGMEHDVLSELAILSLLRGFGSAAKAGAGGRLSAIAARNSVWGLGPTARGNAIEVLLGGNLPRTFPVIDRFLNGVATSIKSIDLRAITYQNPANLERVLTGAFC
jgi:hypothetical protein